MTGAFLCFSLQFQAGFFESKYKQMINDNAEDDPDPGTDGSPSPAEK